MSLKSIIDISVDDKEFKRFHELFSKYQAELAKSPQQWQKVSKYVSVTNTHFETTLAAMKAQQHIAQETNESEQKRIGNLQHFDKLWVNIGRSAKSFAHDVERASTTLLKWGGLMFGGLTAGSLLGIGGLAHNVSNERRSSKGYGMSVGEMQAFKTNFGRLVDPDSFLGWISEMETDPSKASPFAALGGGKLTGNTEADSIRALQLIYSKVNSMPLANAGLFMKSLGVPIGSEDVMRMGKTSAGEFQGLIAGNQRDIGAFATTEKGNLAWQELSTQFQRAGTTIKDEFQSRIASLAPELTELSKALVHLTTDVLRSPLLENSVKRLGKWINGLALDLESPEFEKSMSEHIAAFETTVVNFGKAMEEDLPLIQAWIGKLAHPLDTIMNADTAALDSAAASKNPWLSKPAGVLNWLDDKIANGLDYISGTARYGRFLSGVDKADGLPAGTTELLKWLESGTSLDSGLTSSKGAKGLFQFMPSTAAMYGVNTGDQYSSGRGAGAMAGDLMTHYKGDVAKVLAAYNFGQGHLDDVLKAHPKDWQRYIPSETQNYLHKASGYNPSGFKIQIDNRTGNDVIVSTSQLAY